MKSDRRVDGRRKKRGGRGAEGEGPRGFSTAARKDLTLRSSFQNSRGFSPKNAFISDHGGGGNYMTIKQKAKSQQRSESDEEKMAAGKHEEIEQIRKYERMHII